MKVLPLTFHRAGFNHEQVKRVGNVAIYKRWKPSHATHHYEVIRIKQSKGGAAFGVTFEPQEVYPSSEQWGELGWTCASLSDSERRAATLTPSGASDAS